jgi:hypothetical protein
MPLTPRETATIILFAAVVGLAIVLHKDRREVLRPGLTILRLLADRKVWPVFVGFLAYAFAVVAFAYRLGWWSTDLLKDTLIIVFFTGIPFLMNAASEKDGARMVRHLAVEVVGFAALALFYVNLASFPLWGELLFQAVLAFLVLLEVVASRDPKGRPVSRLLRIIIALMVLCAFVYTTVELATFDASEWVTQAQSLALSILLPLAFLPAVYPLAYFAACESTLVRLPSHNDRTAPPLRVRFAYIIGCHLRLSYATGFTMQWLPALASERTFRGASRLMKNYRAAVQAGAGDVRNYKRQLKEMTGATGVNGDGRWQDRREFHETKELLRGLAYAQMGQARNNGNRYRDDPLNLMFAFNLRKLPEDPGVHATTSADRKGWYAWRKTVGGYYFGVGGRALNIDETWLFEGSEPPSGYPTPATPDWSTEPSGEWSCDDAPPESVRPPGGVSWQR